MNLDTADAAELAELLTFLSDWLATDHDHLDASLHTFIGTHGYNAHQLSEDLARFTFLPGGNDGEPLFQPTQR